SVLNDKLFVSRKEMYPNAFAIINHHPAFAARLEHAMEFPEQGLRVTGMVQHAQTLKKINAPGTAGTEAEHHQATFPFSRRKARSSGPPRAASGRRPGKSL